MRVRRVVTGENRDGKAVLVGDDEVTPIVVALLPGAEFHRIWGCDAVPEVPVSDQGIQPKDWFPPPGGFRFALVTLPPDTATLPGNLDIEEALSEFEEKLPGFAQVMEPDSPGMHTSDSVDVVLIVSGQAILELDDGVQVTLGVGDYVVQNGTRHAWRNPTKHPCTMAAAVVGAHRTPD